MPAVHGLPGALLRALNNMELLLFVGAPVLCWIAYLAFRRMGRGRVLTAQLVSEPTSSKGVLLTARWDDRCADCARTTYQGSRIYWHPQTRQVRHESCGLARASAEQIVFRRGLERMEAAKGAATRAIALKDALAEIDSQTTRRHLQVEYTRLVAIAALDKADALKTAAAKRRHIDAALNEIRRDEVPDDLQAEQIVWLQEARSRLDQE